MNASVKTFFKSKSFWGVILLSFTLFVVILILRYRSIKQAQDAFILNENEKSNTIANTLHDKLKTSYETIRTISLLPAVRTIEIPGQQLTKDANGSIQQLYNNAFLNIQLSEIYILPKNFDHKKIDKVTGKEEMPLAVFDELITDSKEANKSEKADESKAANKIEEVEEFEYALHKNQLSFFENKYPTNTSFEKLNVPLISGSEVITCDNSEFSAEDLKNKNDHGRLGLVFTVPKYDENGKLNGAVSTVLRTKVIESYLPDSFYGLVNSSYNVKIIKNPNQVWINSASYFEKQKNNPQLIYSKRIDVKTADLHSWELWVAIPDSQFYESEDYKNVQKVFFAEIAVLLMAVGFILKTASQNFKRNSEVVQISSDLLLSSDKLNHSAYDLSAATGAIRTSTEEQTLSTSQVASAVQEITQMAARSSENVESLLSISETSLSSAEKSKEDIIKLASALKQIESSEELILKQVEYNSIQLNEIMDFINEIKDKTKLIDDIVFQTKLLSFNASVEAARAGEQGKGFSVVAEEVGKLATSSGTASNEINEKLTEGIDKINRIISDNTKKIKQLIDDSSKNLDQDTTLSQSCIEQLKSLAQLAEEVKLKVVDTQNAINEQEIGLNEIAKSSSEFHLSTKENMGKCENTSTIANELTNDSSNLKEIILRLNKLTQL